MDIRIFCGTGNFKRAVSVVKRRPICKVFIFIAVFINFVRIIIICWNFPIGVHVEIQAVKTCPQRCCPKCTCEQKKIIFTFFIKIQLRWEPYIDRGGIVFHKSRKRKIFIFKRFFVFHFSLFFFGRIDYFWKTQFCKSRSGRNYSLIVHKRVGLCF